MRSGYTIYLMLEGLFILFTIFFMQLWGQHLTWIVAYPNLPELYPQIAIIFVIRMSIGGCAPIR